MIEDILNRHSGKRVALIRNPGKITVYWIPDIACGDSGMTA
jgi:hypothetical protein